MILKFTRLAAFLPVLFAASEAFSCGQGLSMSIGSIPDFSAGGSPTIPVTVSRKSGKNGNNTCSFFLVIDNGITGTSFTSRQLTFGQQPYPVQFFADSGRTNIMRPYAAGLPPANVVIGQFNSPGNADAVVNFYPTLDTSLYIANGQYAEVFGISLYMGDVNSSTFQQTLNGNFTYTNSKKADLSLVDTGTAFVAADVAQSLDFGQLASGAQKAFDLILQYNSGYSLSISSANANRLFNSSTSTYINYGLTLNSLPRALTVAPQVVQTSGGTSPANGLRLPVNVTIGSVTGAKPGNYTDTVTIVISSN